MLDCIYDKILFFLINAVSIKNTIQRTQKFLSIDFLYLKLKTTLYHSIFYIVLQSSLCFTKKTIILEFNTSSAAEKRRRALTYRVGYLFLIVLSLQARFLGGVAQITAFHKHARLVPAF